jgi:hypothetical protein
MEHAGPLFEEITAPLKANWAGKPFQHHAVFLEVKGAHSFYNLFLDQARDLTAKSKKRKADDDCSTEPEATPVRRPVGREAQKAVCCT